MTTRIWRVGILTTLALLLMGAPGRAAPPDEDAPAAIQVVVRGQKSLEEAMRAAASMAWEGGAARPVAIVVDVTPNVQRAGEAIAEALRSLGGDAGAVPSWTIAALGEKLRTAASDPADLASAVSGVLAETTDVVDTFGALEDSIDAWREEDGVVVYLADWHFEDDVDLEDFIEDLQRKGHTLSVVGSEAAFRRGWNDGFREGTERVAESVRGFDFSDYWEGIGRDPFGRGDADAPWHGGDTAYPYAPYRWDALLWSTSFSQTDWDLADLDDVVADGLDALPSEDDLARMARLVEILSELHEIEGALLEAEGEEREPLLARQRELEAELDALQASLPEPEPTPPSGGPGGLPGGLPLPPEDLDPEDLSGRLPGGGGQDEEPPPWIDPTDLLRRFPLPSAYGPYGLMRAAGVTGGRYVLYSWNPSGRKNVVYEYARCNLFPPDLRSRKEILKDLRSNPWAYGMIRAWHEVVDARTEVIEHTPPVKENGRSAARMDRPENLLSFLSGLWENPSEQRLFIKHATRSVEALDEAIEILDDALEDGGEPEGGVAQRYHAEALLLRHTLRVVRFELAELVAAAETVTREDWRREEELGVSGRTWVHTGRDPERVRTDPGQEPYDPEAGQVVLEERKALLARFRGTPFGEELALNDIETARPTTWERVDQVPGTGRSPSESVDPARPTPRPPGGGSGGGGPATGR